MGTSDFVPFLRRADSPVSELAISGPDGTGIRVLPDTTTRTCGFEIVNTAAEQSPGTINRAIAICPYSDCGSATPKGYIAQEAQAERLGQQLYAIIYRDHWQEFTKAGNPKKRLTTKRGFRAATHLDDNTPEIMRMLADNAKRNGSTG